MKDKASFFKLFILFFWLFLSFFYSGYAQKNNSAVKVPALTGRITDNAGIITDGTQAELEKYLESFEQSTGIQVVVLTVSSINEAAGRAVSIEDYSHKIFNTWQPGQSDKDNGVLLFVSVNDRQLRIETGYGLEAVLTDTKCGLIIRNTIIPSFKTGNYEKGITDGVYSIVSAAGGSFEAAESSVNTKETNGPDKADKSSTSIFDLLPFIFWALFILIIVLSNIFGKKHRKDSDDDDDIPPIPPVFGNPCSGEGFGGPWKSGGHGHGGFGGGGGRSGGGGAGGRW